MISKHLDIVVAPSRCVFTNKICALSMPDGNHFAVLLSSFFEAWILEYGGTMGAGRLKIVVADAIQTFPYPRAVSGTNESGIRFYEYRATLLKTDKVGLTKLYNRFHDPDEASADTQKLRQLHVEMDSAVAAAYGWTDLDLGHGFHQTKQGLRYTISESARRDVLARLLKLNHERYAEEVRQGLHEKKKPKATRTKAKNPPSASEPRLFGGEE
jgi:hypothetical protein